jgi:hypothetical protein
MATTKIHVNQQNWGNWKYYCIPKLMIGMQLKKLLDCPAKIICLRCICHEQIHIMGNLTRKCRVSRDTDHLFGIEFARVTVQGAEIS